MPRIVEPSDAAIAEAVGRLRAGDVVAFPTETVYGLGAAIFNAVALERIYVLKGRPADNPLIAHVHDAAQVEEIATGWNARCEKLAHRFWPGPLTLVLHRREQVPQQATAGLPTIAVRCPAHPVAQSLLCALGSPISAPSANRSGHVSPTTAQHVADDFADAASLLILDGGPCEVGIESTVLDMTTETPRILRPGSVSQKQLREVLGEVKETKSNAQAASPGTSLSHYRPTVPAELCSRDKLENRLRNLKDRCAVVMISHELRDSPSLEGVDEHVVYQMPSDPVAYAARFYETLRSAERTNVSHIIIERVPDEPAWAAVTDRLRRATS